MNRLPFRDTSRKTTVATPSGYLALGFSYQIIGCVEFFFCEVNDMLEMFARNRFEVKNNKYRVAGFSLFC